MKKIVVLAIACVITMTGCMQRSVVADNQNEMVAEYMAGILLKNDKSYKKNLIPQEKVERKVTEEVTASNQIPENEKNTGTNNTDAVKSIDNSKSGIVRNASLSEVIGTKDFDIKYTGYFLCNSYPEDTSKSYFSVPARQGNQLLVTTFTIENKTSKEKKLELSSSKVNYQLDINIGIMYKPLLTLLENDLQYMDIKLKSGKKQNVLLIFEVSKDIDMSNINLIVSKGGKTEIIEVK